MDKLYIISDTELHGSSLANMELGLSTGQFKVLTSLDDIANVPAKAIFIHDVNHPNESVLMNEILVTRGLNMKDKDRLMKFMENIYNQIQYVNNLYGHMRSDVSSKQGRDKLSSLLKLIGLTEELGFEFNVIRDSQGVFRVSASNDRMKLIISLLKGYYNNILLPQTKLTGVMTIYPV